MHNVPQNSPWPTILGWLTIEERDGRFRPVLSLDYVEGAVPTRFEVPRSLAAITPLLGALLSGAPAHRPGSRPRIPLWLRLAAVTEDHEAEIWVASERFARSRLQLCDVPQDPRLREALRASLAFARLQLLYQATFPAAPTTGGAAALEQRPAPCRPTHPGRRPAVRAEFTSRPFGNRRHRSRIVLGGAPGLGKRA